MRKVIVVALIAVAFFENTRGAARTAEASPLRIKVEQFKMEIVSTVRSGAARVSDGADHLRTEALLKIETVRYTANTLMERARSSLCPYKGMEVYEITEQLNRATKWTYLLCRHASEADDLAELFFRTYDSYISAALFDETAAKFDALKRALSKCGAAKRREGLRHCRTGLERCDKRFGRSILNGFDRLCNSDDNCRKAALGSLKEYQNIQNQRAGSEYIYPLAYAALGFALYRCQSKPKELDIEQARSGFIWGREVRVALHPETAWFD